MASKKVEPTKVTVKLLINSKGQKVLFAEAGKDFIDFLFNILSMPLGTVIRLLKEQGMVGCLANLYESIENLNENYIQPNQNKDIFLKPMAPSSAANTSILLLNDAPKMGWTFYKCGCCELTYCISDDSRAICSVCSNPMNTQVTYVAPAAANKSVMTAQEGGFVKGVVTYMVMDDLVVKPMSTISSIAMLNKLFNVKDVGSLEEKEVDIGMNEGLKLLKASLQSKSVLTSVFLSMTGT